MGACYDSGLEKQDLGAWNARISSMRVEPANRSYTCDDLRENEIALFENSYFSGDCVVLSAAESYSSPETMGIENDSISSIVNNSALTLRAYFDYNFSNDSMGLDVAPHRSFGVLPGDSWFTNGIDDSTSSIRMY
jgi:hypothetical protein